MMGGIITFLVKLGLGPLLDRAVGFLERRAELEVDKEKLRTELAAEYLRQAVEETRIMADYNKAKLEHRFFWLLIAMFTVPLATWWAAVIADSIFHFAWDVADLPTPQMQAWAGDMIKWLFYVGSGAAALRAALR